MRDWRGLLVGAVLVFAAVRACDAVIPEDACDRATADLAAASTNLADDPNRETRAAMADARRAYDDACPPSQG